MNRVKQVINIFVSLFSAGSVIKINENHGNGCRTKVSQRQKCRKDRRHGNGNASCPVPVKKGNHKNSQGMIIALKCPGGCCKQKNYSGAPNLAVHLPETRHHAESQKQSEKYILISRKEPGTAADQVKWDFRDYCKKKQVSSVSFYITGVEKAFHQKKAKQGKGQSSYGTEQEIHRSRRNQKKSDMICQHGKHGNSF